MQQLKFLLRKFRKISVPLHLSVDHRQVNAAGKRQCQPVNLLTARDENFLRLRGKREKL